MRYTMQGSRYSVPRGDLPAVTRPTKFAAGLAMTSDRSQHKHALFSDALRLSVRGTLDPLSVGNMFLVTRKACPCCGSKQAGKFALSERGHLVLRAARRRRARRLERAA
jgi:hypothetical protein